MKPDEVSTTVYDEAMKKQEELDKLLLKLSEMNLGKDRDRVCAVGKEICDIYQSKIAGKYQFRHQYHCFIEVLRSIQSQDLIDVLLENLKIIIEDNRDNEFACISLLKLYDHISIDIARMSIESEAHNALTSIDIAIKKIDKVTKDSNDSAEELSKKADEAYRKVESIHIEIVAILGVFAAIVIGFTGGLDIIGGSLSNVGVKDFPLILFSISLCGMVLFDVLWLLMECVMRIVKNRNEHVIGNLPVMLFNVAMIVLVIVAFVWDTLQP